MKKFLFFLLTMTAGVKLIAQKVGIGTSTPSALLDVNGPVHLRHNDSTAGFWLQGNAGTNRSFWGIEEESSIGIFGNAGAGWAFNIDLANGYTGIGLANPGSKLDVNGRMRLRTTPSFNAGFSLIGTSNNFRSFFGTIDDNHLGIYSLTTFNWHTAMNVINGNTGFGTTAPTAKLDVNGSMILRGDNPKKGSVLVSSDANGNTMWQPPLGFSVSGLTSFQSIPVNEWRTIPFGPNVHYDEGDVFSLPARFHAPYDGLYEFNLRIGMHDDFSVDAANIRLMLVRNGSSAELIRYDFNQVYNTFLNTNTNPPTLHKDPRVVELTYNTGGLQLNANDSIYAQMYIDGNAWTYIAGQFTTTGGAFLVFDKCNFTGHLIRRL